jgi:hypothetical protein
MSEKRGALSPLRRATGVLVLVAVMVVCGGLGVLLRSDRSIPAGPPPVREAWVIFAALGGLIAALGAVLYGLVLITGCFTFDFTRSYLTTLGFKLWPANLVVQLLFAMGFTFIAAPPIAALLWEVLPSPVALLIGFFLPFVGMQLFLVWFQIWAPLEQIMIRRRMRALGVPPDRIGAGVPIGTSSARPKLRKLFSIIVEEDAGMLWFDADRLVYLGDRVPWSIAREELLAVERDAHKMATSSYFGAVHVVLHYRGPNGEGRLRLHTEGDWTQTSRARALDNLADRLTSWHSGGSPQPPAIGFAVIPAAPAPLPPLNEPAPPGLQRECV